MVIQLPLLCLNGKFDKLSSVFPILGDAMGSEGQLSNRFLIKDSFETLKNMFLDSYPWGNIEKAEVPTNEMKVCEFARRMFRTFFQMVFLG